jgi:lipooligosaccharide transport system permease protein
VTTALPLRAVEASAITFRSTWRGSAFSTFASPVLFLAAMGLGLGSLVDDGAQQAALDGPDYLSFLAPGLLAAAAMQTGSFESLWPVMAGIKWRKSYDAMLATPLSARDIALGHLVWATTRVVMTAVAFVLVMLAFGAVGSWWAALALPAAVLTGAAHAAPLAGVTASLDSDYSIANIMRFGIVPMFLFSGTFFPVEQLPDWLEPLAYVTPLWHGVELCRALCLGDATPAGSFGHVAYLAAVVALGARFTVARFQRRLVA